MPRAYAFNTPIDYLVRSTRLSRAEIARRIRISSASLLKGRAADPERGRLHWTTAYMIGRHFGVFQPDERVTMDDSRLQALMFGLVSTRGRPAPRYREVAG